MDLSGLNDKQRMAAETLEGPVLILAGAGSGKTRALTYRVANLIDHGVPAREILALTFTNKAAKEMKERISLLVGAEAANESWVSTFHSTCARILRRDIEKLGYERSFVIYDDDDQQTLLKEILKNQNIDDKFIPIREVKGKISDAKNKLYSPDEWFMHSARDHRSQLIHDIMTAYENRLKKMNALDFDDLLLKTLELLADHPPVLESYRNRFQYVLVDEYQDTNKAQYEFVRLLTDKSRNLCVVGDDDQSIYGWRGADIRNILDFEKDYPDAKVIKLEQNYRSTSTILDAANQVIANNTDRKDKSLWTQIGEGDKIRIVAAEDERDEAAWIADNIMNLKRAGEKLGDTAVLYRTNAQSRVLEEMLMRASIPYKVFGGQRFYDRKEIRDVIAYLRVIANPTDDISLRRIINVPRRSIGDSTVQMLIDHAAKEGMPLYSALGDLPSALSSRPRKCVTEFFMTMTMLSALKDTMPLESFVEEVIQRTGLREQYAREDSEEAHNRLENMDEFMGAIHEFVRMSENASLESYLENVALVTDLDREDDERGYVTLMTLHSAKGLEFRNVFISGMEENIFPSSRSVMDDKKLEEERRLMYVGITRARQRLYLSRARERMIYNQVSFNPASRFISEIPERLMDDMWPGRQRKNFGKPQSALLPRDSEKKEIYNGRGLGKGFRPALPVAQIGKPKLTFQGNNLGNIPGVTKGFALSKIHEQEDNAMSRLFQKGERVMHRKFGAGVVREITGTGADARISIEFTAYGLKEFALSIAPIIKLED